MAPRYPSAGRESDLCRPDVSIKIQVWERIPNRCVPALRKVHRGWKTANRGRAPIEPPEVTFHKTANRPIPMHPHIYSNGIICLDLLGNQGWSPVQNVESVCMSIQSMLTGNTKNERPPGDEDFVRANKLRPKDIDFYYHDNTV